MAMPGRKFSAGNGYRYGFNGKELDDKDGVVQYDYGFRVYDPRLGRFKSVDPLTKTFPMLTPYQYASNSPIANIDMDGGESKYYSIELSETIDGKGKIIKQSKTTTEEKSKEAGWHMRGVIPWYRSAGANGNGTLYTIYATKRTLKDDGSEEVVVTQIGAIYVPPPSPPSPERYQSTMPFNIIVFGSGSNPDWGLGSKANPNAKTISFNYEEYQALVEPILIGQPDRIPGQMEATDTHKFFEIVGEYGLEKAVDKLKADWEGKPSEEGKYIPSSEICPSCEKALPRTDHKYVKSNVTYLTDRKGRVTDTLKPNPTTGKKDTIPTKPKSK
jgi:RHS repeat-associated protein